MCFYITNKKKASIGLFIKKLNLIFLPITSISLHVLLSDYPVRALPYVLFLCFPKGYHMVAALSVRPYVRYSCPGHIFERETL
jgi:hypothetical protein